MVRTGILCAVVAVTGLACATSNLFIGSRSHKDHRFKKTERIIVATSGRDSESEEKIATLTMDAMTKAGFQIVDDPDSADHILIIAITDSADFSSTTWVPTGEIDGTYLSGSRVGGPSQTQLNRALGYSDMTDVHEGYSNIMFSMHQLKSLAEGTNSLVWQVMLSTPKENVDQYPDEVVRQALKMYGKNKVTRGTFRKPLRSEQ